MKNINRREMLAGLAAGGIGLKTQQPSRPDRSLYIPNSQKLEDRAFLHDFMDEYSFVEVVTSSVTPRITHIPVILDRSSGDNGKIFGHISRENPQSRELDGRTPSVVVFRGPHGYVSPTWHAKTDVVPTWNFAVVHASGRPRPITDKSALHGMLSRLIDKFENYQGSGYDFSKLSETYDSALMERIVGFEMPIESLEGRFKLGQDSSAVDKQKLLEHLRQPSRGERSLHDFSVAFYRRQKAE